MPQIIEDVRREGAAILIPCSGFAVLPHAESSPEFDDLPALAADP